MARRNTVEILYETRFDDRGARAAERSTEKQAKNFDMLSAAAGAAALAYGAARTAQLAWNTAVEGSQILATRDKFDVLAGSIQTTADALLGDLKAATRGYVSDADLMRGANDLIGLGMAKSADEAVRLSSLVGQLNWDMQVLGLTIANQSTARLDSLGLSMEDVKTRAAALAEQGMATDEAFKFAVIEAGEAKLEMFGDAAYRAEDGIKRLNTAYANLKDDAKAAFAQALNAQLSVTADVAEDASSALQDYVNVLGNQFGSQIGYHVAGLERFLAALQNINDEIDDLPDASDALLSTIGGGPQGNQFEQAGRSARDRIEAIRDRVYQLGAAADRAGPSVEELADLLNEFSPTGDPLLGQFIGTPAEVQEVEQTIKRVFGGFIDGSEEAARHVEQLRRSGAQAFGSAMSDMIRDTREEIDPFALAMLESAEAAGASAEQLALLAVATGVLSEEQARAALETAAMSEKARQLGEDIAAGKLTIDQAVESLQAFRTELLGVPDSKTISINLTYTGLDTLAQLQNMLANGGIPDGATFGGGISFGDGPPAFDGNTPSPPPPPPGDATPPPGAFALGGTIAPGWNIVGEQGPEMLHGTTGEVIPANSTRMLAGGGGGGSTSLNQNITLVSQDNNTAALQAALIAKQSREALRGARSR